MTSLEREYTLNEIATSTRAGPAKSLGLENKGQLGLGADADIAIYDLNPQEMNLSKNPKIIRRAFKNAAYTIKDGEIVARAGRIIKSVDGRTFWVKIRAPPSLLEIEPELQNVFEEYYTVKYQNYTVPEKYCKSSAPIEVQANL